MSVAIEPGAIRLVDVELSEPLADLRVDDRYEHVRVLARLHGRPLGTASVALNGPCLDAEVVAGVIWGALSTAIRDHCREDGLTQPGTLTADGLGACLDAPCSWRAVLTDAAPPLATVVVTTCGDDGRRLHRTVADVLAQTYPRLEVVVVDNRPGTSSVRADLGAAFPGDPRVRYVAEARRGLSHARNAGTAAALGEIVAFTDDDVSVDRDWLGCLVAGFHHRSVDCVTGLILPLELDTGAQRLLEEFGGYSKGFRRRIWDRDEHRPDHPLYPYTVGAFGSGANAAFRKDVLSALGGFDVALGAGTRARGGEDIDIYVTCVQRGYRIAYEPGAIVRHAHLRDMAQVQQKLRDYGVGLGAMLTKHLLRDPATFLAMATRVPSGLRHLFSAGSPKNAGRSCAYPASLVRAELAGLAYGPVAYLRSRASS